MMFRFKHVVLPRIARSSGVFAVGVCALVSGLGGGRTELDHLDTQGAQQRLDVPVRRQRTAYVHCTAVVAARQANKATYACEGVLRLSAGKLAIQLLLVPGDIGATVHGSVTGGTGAYANARGTVVSKTTKTGACRKRCTLRAALDTTKCCPR